MSRPRDLSTTAYAILGLLAIRPWTTYELAGQMERSMRHFWPRARSKIFEEPKRLAAEGLARATVEAVGRRPRTVYSITPKGRRALARWMAEPGAPPELEYEQLLKVFLAEHGTKEDLLRQLAAARAWAEARHTESRETGRAYLAGEGPFPERAAHLMLVGKLLADFAATVARWAAWATDVVEDWPEDVADATPDLAQIEAIVNARL